MPVVAIIDGASQVCFALATLEFSALEVASFLVGASMFVWLHSKRWRREPSAVSAQRQAHSDDMYVLSAGYIGSAGLLETIQKVVLTLREVNPELVYVCDPVLGDHGRLYLPAEMVSLYRANLVQLATVLTPNQFEAEQLTQQPIRTEQEALQACEALLRRGPSTVVRAHLVVLKSLGLDNLYVCFDS